MLVQGIILGLVIVFKEIFSRQIGKLTSLQLSYDLNLFYRTFEFFFTEELKVIFDVQIMEKVNKLEKEVKVPKEYEFLRDVNKITVAG